MKLKALLLFAILSVAPTLYGGTVTGTMQGPSGLPVKNATLTFQLQQAGLLVGTGNVAQLTSQCWTSTDGTVVGTPNPLTAPAVATGPTGTLPSATYFVKYTFYSPSGETLASPESRIQTSVLQSIVVSPPASFPAGATGIKVYIGTTSNTETLQGTTASPTAQYTQSVPLVAGASIPTTNGTVCTVAFNDTIIPYAGYNVSLTSATSAAYPGWPQAWQLNGGLNGTINISQGAPLWNGTVIYPTPLLSQPLNHGPQSISGSLNMSGYDITNVGNLNASTSLEGAYLPPTIPNAISLAGGTGSVLIPPFYQGTESWTNPNNVRVGDNRPLGANGHYPSTTVKAAEYGALCNGGNDDTAAIQAAVDAQTVLSGGADLAPIPIVPATVELPQGLCIIHSPIVISGWGSIEGSANGTWLQAAEPWSGAAMIELMFPYNNGSAFLPGGYSGTATINRFVRDINFQYAAHAHAVTGVKVFNETGTTVSMPYPTGVGGTYGIYQIPGVTIQDNAFFALDTAIDLEDCGECVIDNNQILDVHTGVLDGGNNFSVRLTKNAIQQGSNLFTPNTGATFGVFIQLQSRWQVGDTVTPSLIVTPQGFTASDNIITTFDTDLKAVNLQGMDLHDNGFDFGGDGAQPGTANPTIYIGTLNWAQIHHNLVANFQPGAVPIEIVPANNDPGDTSNLDGLWITDNFIQSYSTGSSVAGVNFDVGAFPRRNVYIQNNQFSKLGFGINVQQGLQNSIIRGNYGFFINTALLRFNASAGYPQTVVADNTLTDSVPVLQVATGGGLVVGYNQSASGQLTGTFVASAASCTISSPAIGAVCGPVSVLMPTGYSFGDLNYTVDGCSITGGDGASVVSVVSPLSLGNSFAVFVTGLSNAATGGGTIHCTVHNDN